MSKDQPAFPQTGRTVSSSASGVAVVSEADPKYQSLGLSKLEYFSGRAMQALVSKYGRDNDQARAIARESIAVSKMLLAELAKEQK